jgi:signal transduction histidine kinase
MKKYLCLFLLVSIQIVHAQNIDSVKTVLKDFAKEKPSLARDSSITNAIATICYLLPISNVDDQSRWVDSLKRFARKSLWIISLPKSYQLEGSLLQRKGFFTKSISNFEKAAQLFEKYKDLKNYSLSISSLSVGISNELFFNEKIDITYLNKYQKYLETNLEVMKKLKNPVLIANQETILGLFYFMKKEYKKAYHHYQNSEIVSREDTVKYFYGYYGGIWAKGLCLLYLNKTNEGFDLIKRVQNACEKPQPRGIENYLKAVIGLFLGNYYNSKMDYKNALAILIYGEEGKQKAGNTFFDKHYAKVYFTTYKKLGNYKKALEYHEILQKINSSEEQRNFKEKYTEYQLKYDDEKRLATIKTLENEKLQKENESKDFTRNVLIFSLLAGLGLVFYIYQNNIKLSSKNKQLSTKNREIEEAHYKGQTIERKRIGVELHDNLSAKIGAIRWRLESLEPKFDTKTDADFYATTIDALNETYADVRLIAHNMLPEILEEKGLVIAIQSLVNELNGLNKTKFSFEILGDIKRYPNKIEYELYSILLELTNNILKHAKANAASISIHNGPSQLNLLVKDDGIGFEKNDLKFGMGLSNIKSRLETLNGALAYNSENGMTVEILLKLG